MSSDDLTLAWRPRSHIRPIVIGLFRRDDRLLSAAVTEDDGAVKGWRPLGGGINFGETAECALAREMREELGATIGSITRLAVLENLFTHHGAQGHEIVFVLTANFVDPGLAADEDFVLEDGGVRSRAAWVPISEFRTRREYLLPAGLIEHI